jgi:hypothetical protein
MIRITKYLFPFLLASFLITSAYSQEQENKINTVDGRVVDMDWVSSVIVVSWLDVDRGFTYDEIRITVTNDAASQRRQTKYPCLISMWVTR